MTLASYSIYLIGLCHCFFIVIRFIGVEGNTTAWPTSSSLQNAFDLMQPPIISIQRSKHFTFLFKFYIYIHNIIYTFVYSNYRLNTTSSR